MVQRLEQKDILLIAEHAIGLTDGRDRRDAERLLLNSELARNEYSLWIQRLDRLMPHHSMSAPEVLPRVLDRIFGAREKPALQPILLWVGLFALVVFAILKVGLITFFLDGF